jgi:hypothetical protein
VIKHNYDKKNLLPKIEDKKFPWYAGPTWNKEHSKQQIGINLGNHKIWEFFPLDLLKTLHEALSTNLILLCMHLQGQKS